MLLYKLLRNIGKGSRKLFGIIAQKSKEEFGNISKHLDNARENYSKRLQSKPKKLYNKERLKKIGEGEEVHVIVAKITRSS